MVKMSTRVTQSQLSMSLQYVESPSSGLKGVAWLAYPCFTIVIELQKITVIKSQI